ncbi:MAG: hypothetical protein II680_01185, partial [Clostridia bacterium]|nr:hypothetical protein [Clostridia bacterium]
SSAEDYKQQVRTLNGHDYWGEQTEPYIDALDIVGYNYMYARYESDLQPVRTETEAPDPASAASEEEGTESDPAQIEAPAETADGAEETSGFRILPVVCIGVSVLAAAVTAVVMAKKKE